MELAPRSHTPNMEVIKTLSTLQRAELLYDALQQYLNFLKQHKVDSQTLISQRDEIDLIQTYRTALFEHEERELKLDRSAAQLKERMRVETEWYKENIIGQWSHPMGNAPQRRIMTRSVTRSKLGAQSKVEQGMQYLYLRMWKLTLTRYLDAALEGWKQSMDKIRDDSTTNQQSMEEERARWAAEVTTNLRDAKALSEAAEVSGVDVVAKKASLKLLINKHNTRAEQERAERVAAVLACSGKNRESRCYA